MTKRQHPIRIAYNAMSRAPWHLQERVLARHVKPLLDALWDDHTICRDMEDDKQCRICRLIAAWKEPIK